MPISSDSCGIEGCAEGSDTIAVGISELDTSVKAGICVGDSEVRVLINLSVVLKFNLDSSSIIRESEIVCRYVGAINGDGEC